MDYFELLFSLRTKKEELEKDLEAYLLKMSKLKKGTLFKKDNYYYIKYYEGGKTISSYVGKDLSLDEINNIQHELDSYKTFKLRMSSTQKELKEVNKLIEKYERKHNGH